MKRLVLNTFIVPNLSREKERGKPLLLVDKGNEKTSAPLAQAVQKLFVCLFGGLFLWLWRPWEMSKYMGGFIKLFSSVSMKPWYNTTRFLHVLLTLAESREQWTCLTPKLK